ncbi:MAG: hypothetical protein RLZZ218_737, partial [Actinomycetota bacterium]
MSDPKEPMARFYSVIPAGGIGSRLWPLSAPLSGADRIVVVTGVAHRSAVSEQCSELVENNLFLEPSPKDSTAAIALAAAILVKREPDVIIGSFAADHVITDNKEFSDCVREAVAVAATGKIVTIGIQPTEPSVGFGYIK